MWVGNEYQNEVKALFARYEAKEISFEQLRNEVNQVVQEVEDALCSELEKQAGDDI